MVYALMDKRWTLSYLFFLSRIYQYIALTFINKMIINQLIILIAILCVFLLSNYEKINKQSFAISNSSHFVSDNMATYFAQVNRVQVVVITI